MKKNILFYIETLQVGGIEKVLIELLKNIDKEKFDINLLIGYHLPLLEKFKNDIPNEIKIEYLLKDDIFCKFKEKKALGKLCFYEKVLNEILAIKRKKIMGKKLLDLLDKEKIECVIDFDMTLATYVKRINCKKITFCHFSLKNYHRGIKSRQEKLLKRLEKYNRLIVISDKMKEEAIEIYPNLEKNIVRLYNSFNIEEIRKKAEEEIEELKDKKYILAVGRLEETQKDFTTLIKGYSKVCNEIEEELYIIGEGRHKQQLENLVKELKIENRVRFLGFKSNPYPYMRNASLFIHSSKFEGLPTVMIEALILGKLIIATDCPTGPKEILNNGKNGILTKLGDENNLADAIRKMLIPGEKNNIFLQNSLNYIKEFDSNNVVKKFEKMIEEV